MADVNSGQEQTPETPETPKDTAVEPVKVTKSSNKTLIIVLVIVAVIVVLPALLFGAAALWIGKGDNAEKLTENIIEKATGSDVDIDTEDNSFSIETDEGSFSAQSGEQLADDFPEAVILYDKQTITGTFNQSSDTQKSWSVTAETDSSSSDVASFFTDKYKDWDNSGSYSYDTVRGFTYEKDDIVIIITVSKDEDDEKTNLSYTVNVDEEN